MSGHIIEIARNREGGILAYMWPVDDDGKESCSGYRIAGPKAWGGSVTLAKIKIDDSSLEIYLKKYAADLWRKMKEFPIEKND